MGFHVCPKEFNDDEFPPLPSAQKNETALETKVKAAFETIRGWNGAVSVDLRQGICIITGVKAISYKEMQRACNDVQESARVWKVHACCGRIEFAL